MHAQIKAKIVQRPVGQGGLCEGEVSFGGPPLRWVYDCGSNQLDALGREIDLVGGPIDILFISHLDNDHINGIDRLLYARACTELVLPYLNDEERLIVLADSVASGASGQFVDFISDPAGWALRRGVSRVTYLEGREDGEGELDTPLDGPPEDSSGGELIAKWTQARSRLSSPTGGDVGLVPAGAVLTITCGGAAIGWGLSPHVFRPPASLTDAFWRELKGKFPGANVQNILEESRRSDGRAMLRACYDALWLDHNLVSMSLHAGPSDISSERWRVNIDRHFGHGYLSRGLGWLSTGDSDLSRKRRLNSLLSAYRRYLDTIAVLVLPHHGAAASFDPALLNSLSALCVGVAPAGPNPYDHPSKSVREAVMESSGAWFVKVSQKPATALRYNIELRP